MSEAAKRQRLIDNLRAKAKRLEIAARLLEEAALTMSRAAEYIEQMPPPLPIGDDGQP